VARALLSLIWLCLIAVPLAGQTPDTTAGTSDIGLSLDLPVPPLRLVEPAALRAPWLAAPRLGPAAVGERWDSTMAVTRDSVRQERALAHRLLNIYGVAP
jgi:hypothetical protein